MGHLFVTRICQFDNILKNVPVDRIRSEHTIETNLANYIGADGKDGLLEVLLFGNTK